MMTEIDKKVVAREVADRVAEELGSTVERMLEMTKTAWKAVEDVQKAVRKIVKEGANQVQEAMMEAMPPGSIQ
jgi:Glu-tRNA(Gln) amidotransferase subunit E-like FAD-binding protein